MCVRQHAHGRAHPQPPGPAEQQGRQRHRRRADPVRDEVVFGEPDRIEPGLLGHLRGPYRPVQCLALSLARELGRQNKRSYAHRL